jgi:hypothetical protein
MKKEKPPPKPRTPERIAEFAQRHRALIAMLEAELANTTKEAPPILYHYTSGSAALNIIKTGALWATHSWYMNDSSELEFGRGVYLDVIERLKNLDHHERFREFLDSSDIVTVLMRYSTAFACCFSAAENQLSQWRAYSALGTSTGYSLGFDPTGLKQLTFRGKALLLMKVFYGPNEQRDIVERVLAAITVHLERLEEEVVNEDWFELLSFIIRWLQVVVIGLKRPDFREEREWRLVYSTFGLADPTELNYRTSETGVVVPYCELRGPESLPLTKVIIGPTREKDIASFSFEQVLKKYNYQSTTVAHCDIPLRSL